MVPPADIPGLPNDITPLLVFLAIGLVAGWLASLVLGGGGLLRNLIVGVIGSFVGGYVLNLAGIQLPINNVWVSSIVTATIGALLVIVVARVVAKSSAISVKSPSQAQIIILWIISAVIAKRISRDRIVTHGHASSTNSRLPRPRHPEKAHRPENEVLRKPDWIRVKAPVRRSTRRPADRAREQSRHRVRGGRLPQYRRVLGQEARHHDDHGRDLHPRLRLLQRAHRLPTAARSDEPENVAARSPSSGWRMSSSPRSIATISPMAAPSISPGDPRHPRARRPRPPSRS
jgi:uncharacterized membrane protein YeaQ/YmgE (transglycosylase-associated protein family)